MKSAAHLLPWILPGIMLMHLTVHAGEGCKDEVDLALMNREVAEDVRSKIRAELPIGSDGQEIRAFFERHEITYTYDRFTKRYQGIIRDVSAAVCIDQAVSIYVYVDGQGRYKSAEVRNSFTHQ
jgi:hypothetical protein